MFCPKFLHGCIRNQGWARSLGPEPEFALLCRVILSVVEARHTAPRLSALPVLSSFGGGVGIVLLAYSRSQVSVTRPARPEPLSSQTRCFKVQNLTAGLAGVI